MKSLKPRISKDWAQNQKLNRVATNNGTTNIFYGVKNLKEQLNSSPTIMNIDEARNAFSSPTSTAHHSWHLKRDFGKTRPFWTWCDYPSPASSKNPWGVSSWKCADFSKAFKMHKKLWKCFGINSASVQHRIRIPMQSKIRWHALPIRTLQCFAWLISYGDFRVDSPPAKGPGPRWL